MDGGQQQQSPQQTQTQITDLPEWAKPYAQKTLAKAEALTAQPYQTYDANRIAGFSPLQQQAFQGAQQLGPTQQTAMGSNLAAASGLGALGTGYRAGRFSGGQFTPMAAGQYMSPFIEQAMAPQLREAQRSSDIMGQQNAAKAAQMGAFGGSRQGLMEAERQRNLGMQLGDIRGRGYQTAYEQAAGQFNQDMARRMQAQQLGEQSRQFGANIGLQGLQTGLQAAGQLGALGQQQFAQQQGAIEAQSRAGAQQQALEQQGLTQAYQDFLNQQNYPYKQLGFMSDMIRGMPLGQQSTSSIYQAPPSALQTAGALGLGAYGLSKMMANGGLVGYADGGSVESPENVANIVSKLSDQQLVAAEAAAKARGDFEQLQAIMVEKGVRASERKGMASIYNRLPPEQQAAMAGGGIVAFQAGGVPSVLDALAEDEARVEEGSASNTTDDESAGNRPGHERLIGRFEQVLNRLEQSPTFAAQTPTQAAAALKTAYDERTKFAGADPYGPMRQRLKEEGIAGAEALKQAQGLGALKAMSGLLQPGGFVRGVGAAGGAFADVYGQALQADRAQKRYLGQMEFNLADAERKERLGLTKEARADVQNAEANRLAAYKAGQTKDVALATALSRGITATRPAKSTGSGPKVAEQLAAAEIAFANNPTPQNRRIVEALRSTVSQTKTSWTTGESGPGRLGAQSEATQAGVNRDIDTQVNKQKYMDQPWLDAMAKGDTAGQAAAEQRIRQKIIDTRKATTPSKGKPSDDGVNKNSTIAPNISTIQGAPKGSRIGSNTAQGWEILDSSGTLIGYAK